ncbi:hypothetical protein ACRE_058150 [Hapsidospora chrysogenum ATCC 11550]|uniref:AT hook domain-containing protein n=1 Tax=Hapsidospora chrysogenum (strain ATCC 11550 / CBS 779.69 / DSM 880 / IAM 14645 / JCM 23072 / IMI 49137) TaxID=857340 RepID=A0A086T257_HAPC1|nr:hypothetical protein ACRE_058150 [Hapsidospora chrysogenum ATCC 11550]
MARAVIADSDDDDDLGYSPPSQSPERPDALRGALSSDRVENHSESTDPAFFQSIFEEQSEAARREAGAAQGRRGGSGAATAGREDGLGASSLMSTDPLQGRDDDDVNEGGPGVGVLTATPKRGHKVPNDPWEVPSSMEEPPRSITPQRKTREEKKKKKGKSESKKSQRHSSPDQAHDGLGGRSTKRRKTNSGRPSTLDAEHIDLIELPSTQDVDEEFQAPIMPPPTLPVDRTSFIVAPKPLNSGRRDEYQSYTMPSDEELSQDQGPICVPGGRIAWSSGEATNVNTPRSEMPSSRNLDVVHEEQQECPGELELEDATARWNSSPDEIALDGPTQSTAKRKPKAASGRAGTPSGRDTSCTPADMRIKYSDREGDDDFVEKPVKPKKQRGRPRKKEGTLQADGSPAPSGSKRSATNSKKKRGRPRKADQQVVDGADEATNNTAAVDEDAKAEDGVQEEEEHTVENQDGDAAQAQPATAAADAEELAVPKRLQHDNDDGSMDKGKGGTISGSRPDSEANMSKDVAEKGSLEVGRRSEGKGAAVKAAGTWTWTGGPRPLYRVGLSKRTKIAPLLKSVRK